MRKHSKLISIISAIVGSLFFAYALVVSPVSVFGDGIDISFKLSSNIYSDSSILKETRFVFKSYASLEKTTIVSDCNIFSEFEKRQGNYYSFKVKFLDTKCESTNLHLVNSAGEQLLSIPMKIYSDISLYSQFIDFSNSDLELLLKNFEKHIQLYSKFEEFANAGNISYYKFLTKNRTLEELKYSKKLITTILTKRKELYATPVKGYKMPTMYNKIPNTGRPYRAAYTDGIHHGWDIDAQLGEPVQAIDDGIILRIVSGFEYSDLNKLQTLGDISDEVKKKNLDILRGNQVWIKTIKGDVIFYSHLNEIYSQVKEGNFIAKGTPVGTIGASGVPDKDYTDYHLHFTVQKNPYTVSKAGKYTLEDYMNWDWYFKGESQDYILEHQGSVFEG